MHSLNRFFLISPGVLLLLALALPIPMPLAAQDAEPGTAEVLGEMLDSFLAGASINDRATHERFWADDLIYTSSGGERFGKAEILSGMGTETPADPNSPRYSASDVHVQDFGVIAVVTFRLHAHQGEAAIGEYLNTGVFRKGPEGWKAVTWQATRAGQSAD